MTTANSLKNYYQILDLPPTATPGDIKKAYRRLAQQYHPDRNTGSHAPSRFMEIQEAYNILSHPSKKRKYDAQYYFNGVSKQENATTPTALRERTQLLARKIAHMDPYRINRDQVFFTIKTILSPGQISLLVEHGEVAINRMVVQDLLTCCKVLATDQLQWVVDKLGTIDPQDVAIRKTLDDFKSVHRKLMYWEKYQVPVALLLTLLCCLLIYMAA